jgi:aminocarboxymuconate-semialdehyde decarboxylase
VNQDGAAWPTIDLHTHILPENWDDLDRRYGYPGFVNIEPAGHGCAKLIRGGKCFREIAANCWDAVVRIEECAKAGVDVKVLSTVPVMFSYWARATDALDLGRRLNDHIAEIVRAHPTRFVGLGTLPLQDPQLSIAELERCCGELGLAGVQIGTHVNDWELDRPELFPVFQRAAELGAAVFIHPWDMLGQDRMKKYWLPWLVGMPTETTLAVCALIFGGILERLPSLRVAFAHGGGSFAGTFGRIEHGFRVRPDLCATDNPVEPRRYLGKFWVDSLVHDEAMLRHLMQLFGPRKIALGTDYPFPLGELEPGRLIRELNDLSAEERGWLLGRSAVEFLGVDGSGLHRAGA